YRLRATVGWQCCPQPMGLSVSVVGNWGERPGEYLVNDCALVRSKFEPTAPVAEESSDFEIPKVGIGIIGERACLLSSNIARYPLKEGANDPLSVSWNSLAAFKVAEISNCLNHCGYVLNTPNELNYARHLTLAYRSV